MENEAELKPRHIPVMKEDVLSILKDVNSKGVIVDATFGAGGYTEAILAETDHRVVAIDRDDSVIDIARRISKKYNGRFDFIHDTFSNGKDRLIEMGSNRIDGVVFDIGLSSMQIDDPGRGFSFMNDGPLDMRMGKNKKTAKEFIDKAKEEEIANVIMEYGEEKRYRSIAKTIYQNRFSINSTKDLSNVIKRCLKGPEKFKIKTVARVFQAIRIHINSELDEISKALEDFYSILKDSGVLIVVSFHSLEDRIVKFFMKEKNDLHPIFKKVKRPTQKEIALNKRSRSAKMRAARKE